MGLSSDQAHKRQQSFKAKIDSIFSIAIYCKQTHEQILSARNVQLYLDKRWKLPARVQAYLSGYWDARSKELYAYHLEWRHMVDGELITIPEANKRRETDPGLYSRIQTCRSGYFWKNHPDKPF